jgi:branched-chain amino acid transport system permease protein
MLKQRPFLVEGLTAIGLILAPFILPYLGFAPSTMSRILVWALFGLGFDILFGYTGLLSFGQSAFFGTGGMIAAYLLTVANFPFVTVAISEVFFFVEFNPLSDYTGGENGLPGVPPPRSISALRRSSSRPIG